MWFQGLIRQFFFNIDKIVLAGGVSANSYIRKEFDRFSQEKNIQVLDYNINEKQIEKELLSRNEAILAKENLDKNGLVRKYFDLNKELIKVQRKDPKLILDRFLSGVWKIKDFNDKEMSVLYDRLSIKNYYECSEEEQQEIDLNFGKLLNTLQEYKVYLKYKFIIDDLRERFKNKDGYKAAYDNKLKELRKKEQDLLTDIINLLKEKNIKIY